MNLGSDVVITITGIVLVFAILVLLMLIIMFPGMITGSSTAAVLSAGAIVAPILLDRKSVV